MDRSTLDRLSVRTYGASHGSHDHDHFQILLGLEGVLELEVAGRGRRIAAGDGCVVLPGERHDFEARHGARCLVLDSRSPAWGRATATPDPALAGLAHHLATACTRGWSTALQVGPALLREAWCGAAPAPARARRAIDWDALQHWAAARWAERPLSVADLAAQVHLSPAQFAARCRAERHQSTQQWLRGLQLAQARTLRDQGTSVADAARLTGYRSPSALTAALRRGN